MGAGEERTFTAEGRGALTPALIGGGVALLVLVGLGAWLGVRRRTPARPATEAGTSAGRGENL